MTISVNANRSALNALQTLARGSDPSAPGQTRTSTQSNRLKDGRDDAIAAPRGEAVSLAAAKRNLDRAAALSDVALGAGQSVSELLERIREAAAEAAEGEGRRDATAHLRAAVRQIEHVVRSARFDGVNLLDGSSEGDLRFDIGGGSQLALSPRDLTPGGDYVTLAADAEMETEVDAAGVLARAEASAVNVSSALADLRVQSKQIEAHTRFLARFGAAAEGVGEIDADLSKEGARLQALHIQQQLAGQRLSIANQAPQMVLQLFRS